MKVFTCNYCNKPVNEGSSHQCRQMKEDGKSRRTVDEEAPWMVLVEEGIGIAADIVPLAESSFLEDVADAAGDVLEGAGELIGGLFEGLS